MDSIRGDDSRYLYYIYTKGSRKENLTRSTEKYNTKKSPGKYISHTGGVGPLEHIRRGRGRGGLRRGDWGIGKT